MSRVTDIARADVSRAQARRTTDKSPATDPDIIRALFLLIEEVEQLREVVEEHRGTTDSHARLV